MGGEFAFNRTRATINAAPVDENAKKIHSQPAFLIRMSGSSLIVEYSFFFISLHGGYRKMSCICLQGNHHPVNATSPNELVLKFNARAPFVEFCTVSLVMNFNLILGLVNIEDADFVQCFVWPPFF